MVAYDDRKLLLFGGAAAYLRALTMRLCLDDLHIFDVSALKWTKVPETDLTAPKRMNHVADTIGCIMLVHGGHNTEIKKTLDDFNLFDIELGEWIKCEITDD